jgi:UDP-2-acetamido-2-deoxy-ribo-hexuluronate aminotransferase
MNAPFPQITQFVDLKAQYAALRDKVDARIRKVLEHGQFIMGPEVDELEQTLALRTGAAHCITCASGTEALLIALMALDIGPGDEVITTPFTFVSTAEMIALLGARPIFVDIEADTCNIDANRIEDAISERTKAIMPVSLYGQPADMDAINVIAADHGLSVIEDAAQSFGAEYKGRQSCNLSTVGCTSFFPSKPLGCYGDGGAVFTSDDDLATKMREVRTHGQKRRYYHTRIGVGGRMDTIQCAVVLAKLERFDWEIRQRAAAGRRYDELLESSGAKVRTLAVRPDRTSVYAQYTVLSDDRDNLQGRLKARGVPTAVHYPLPLHHQPAYRRYSANMQYQVSEQAARQVISLPMHADLDPELQRRIVEIVAEESTHTESSG